jgi:hypothetical protein
MAASIREFHVGLYREHLEESSFLYAQRRSYLYDPEVNWPDLHDWEERFEAHIDALIIGADLALEVCQQVDVGDAGQAHAALRVLSRHKRKADVFALLGKIDLTDGAAVEAATEALCRDSPSLWQGDFLNSLERESGPLTQVLARVLGYRRFASEEVLRIKLAQASTSAKAELAWALGRVGSASALPRLYPLLEDADGRVREAASIAVLRLGDSRGLRHAATAVETPLTTVLGLAGGPDAVRMLLNRVTGPTTESAVVVGLGLLGHLSAMTALLDLLEHADVKHAAATALNTITGAQLYANVFVPDKFDRDELSDEERDAFDKDGTLPTRAGKPYGNWERRPLLDKAAWHAWLDENKHRFNRQRRWRMGRPYGPIALFECLRCETTPYAVRAATYEELVIRYGLDVPFEVDLPVSQQYRFLPKIESWTAAHASAFDDGEWYFAGRRQA